MSLFSKKVSCIGLDIGDYTTKALEIKKSGSGYEITNYANVRTPQGLIEGHNLLNESGIVDLLRSVSNKIQMDSPKVALAVSGENVFVRNLNLPVMPDKELAEAVRFEVESLLPLPGKDVTIDFVKNNVVMEGAVKKQRILTVAVRSDTIKKLVRIAEQAGYQPSSVDIEPLVLLRALKKLNKAMVTVGTSFAVVNIGSASTSISVFHGDNLAFTRTLGIGGYKLSTALINQYNMTMDEADSTKKLIDLAGEFDQHGLSVLLYQKQEVLMPVIGELVTEIGRSLEYYMAQNRDKTISQVYITGGGAQMKGLDQYMTDELGVPVSTFVPTEFLKLSNKVQYMENEINENGAALTQVVGLALSEVE